MILTGLVNSQAVRQKFIDKILDKSLDNNLDKSLDKSLVNSSTHPIKTFKF